MRSPMFDKLDKLDKLDTLVRSSGRRRVRGLVAAGTAAVLVAGAAIATVPGAQASPRPVAAISSIDSLQAAAPAGLEPPAAVLSARSATLGFSVERSMEQAAQLRAEMRELALRKAVVRLARQQLGDSYVRGASGPNAFDCSGLVRYVFSKVVGKQLPHSSRAQYGVVKKIKRSQAKPGDLVFFFRNGARHVGIYIGGGRMIDARNPGKDVAMSPISTSWWGRSYTGMGRIIADA